MEKTGTELKLYLAKQRLLRERDYEFEKYAAHPEEHQRIADEFAKKFRDLTGWPN